MSEGTLCLCGCGEEIPPGEEQDGGYRDGSDGREIELWLHARCEEDIYDEAMSYLP